MLFNYRFSQLGSSLLKGRALLDFGLNYPQGT